ncbi:MAG: hypothetical protein V1902_00115 [Candidatus Falkowbacteria bacterium]
MNEGCRPAHEVIVHHLEAQVDFVHRSLVTETLDIAFSRYAQVHALLFVLEEMVIPEQAVSRVISALHGISERFKEMLPMAGAFHARMDKAVEILVARKKRSEQPGGSSNADKPLSAAEKKMVGGVVDEALRLADECEVVAEKLRKKR